MPDTWRRSSLSLDSNEGNHWSLRLLVHWPEKHGILSIFSIVLRSKLTQKIIPRTRVKENKFSFAISATWFFCVWLGWTIVGYLVNTIYRFRLFNLELEYVFNLSKWRSLIAWFAINEVANKDSHKTIKNSSSVTVEFKSVKREILTSALSPGFSDPLKSVKASNSPSSEYAN